MTTQPGQRTIFYLNQWISSDPAAGTAWQPDRMLDSLPRALRNTPGLERLTKTAIQLRRHRLLAGRFSGWTTFLTCSRTCGCTILPSACGGEPAGAQLAAVAQGDRNVGGAAGGGATGDGRADARLDDAEYSARCTCRRIPKDPLATAGSTETVLPSVRGEVGPGYAHLPLEMSAVWPWRCSRASADFHLALPAGGNRRRDARFSGGAIDGAARLAAGGVGRRQAVFVRHGAGPADSRSGWQGNCDARPGA